MRSIIATVLASVAVAATTVPADAVARPHRACKYEDSSSCVWDARHNGNGRGRSFWTDGAGTVHYVTHARAHAMIHGGVR